MPIQLKSSDSKMMNWLQIITIHTDIESDGWY